MNWLSSSDELAARRLSAAIHDTGFERFLWRLSRVLWWPGDKVDAMRCRRQWRRAQLDHNARRRP